MWNTVLVFFIWNENISSSQIAQAIWSAFRWQGITKAADIGQIRTCGVQLEKTSCPCYQSHEITSYSPSSSSKEIGLIVLEINPSLLTEARRQQGCAWGHQCGCSAERALPLLQCCSCASCDTALWRPWASWDWPGSCHTAGAEVHEWFLQTQLPWGSPLHLAALAPRPAHPRFPESMAELVSSCTLLPLLLILIVHLPRKCRKTRTSFEHNFSSWPYSAPTFWASPEPCPTLTVLCLLYHWRTWFSEFWSQCWLYHTWYSGLLWLPLTLCANQSQNDDTLNT